MIVCDGRGQGGQAGGTVQGGAGIRQEFMVGMEWQRARVWVVHGLLFLIGCDWLTCPLFPSARTNIPADHICTQTHNRGCIP